jgi:ABC-2 type transport system permease protein
MRTLMSYTKCLLRQCLAEIRLFWRSQETVFLTFLVPMMATALFIYLNREGMLASVFDALFRGLGRGHLDSTEFSPISFMTLGMITYCVIAASFESPLPKLVRERSDGILKRLNGSPIRVWVYLTAKALSANILVLVEVVLIFVVGMVSKEFAIAGNSWELLLLLLLGTFMLSGLAFALSNLAKTFDSAILIVHAVYIPMLLLCGAFVPVEALPGMLRGIARVMPLTYFVAPFRSVMVEGANLASNLGDLAILGLWTIVGWALAIRTFKWV